MINDARMFYFAVIVFASGVLLRSFYEVNLSVIVFLALIGLVVGWCGRGLARGQSAAVLLSIGILIFLFSFGIFRLEWASWNDKIDFFEKHLNEEIAFEGIIVREPDERESTVHLYVKNQSGLILVTVAKGEEWNYGDKVEVVGMVEYPEEFETDLGRTFDYRGYLLAKGVAYMISFAEVKKIGEDGGNSIIADIFEFKNEFITKLELRIPEPEAGLSLGLLLGVKRALGQDLEEAFRRSGIIHIVVLSGYNIMIVVAFILYVLGRLCGRRLSMVLGILSIITFAVMVGLGATVVRASIMAVLLLLMNMTGRVYLVLRGLFLAAALMILWNPYSLAFDIGFQLSFLATLGLIIFSPYLQEKLKILPEKGGIREFVTATLATQLFVLPLLLYQMGEFSVVAVIVNVLVLPMVPAAMLLSFLTGVLGFLSPALAAFLSTFTYLSLAYIIVLAEWFSDLPLAAFSVPAFSFVFVPIAYLGIFWLVWFLQSKPNSLLKGWRIVEET